MKAMRAQFADTMLAVGQEDPRLVVLIGDISHFILQPFAQACPGRFYNIGICEPTIVSMGAGLAKAGLRPVLHTIAPFLLERSFEQIKLDFCYQKLGGTLVTVGSAFDYGVLGCTHHCYDDWALLKSLPGTQILYPASPVEFDALFRQTYGGDLLTLIRVPEKQHGHAFDAADLRVGKALRVAEGRGLTLVATGPHLAAALAARQELAARGWEPDVFYVPTIHPLDAAPILESVRRTRRLVVLEEHLWLGGVGCELQRHLIGLEGLIFEWIGIPDGFIRDYRSYEEHCQALGLSREGILGRVRAYA